MPAVRRPSRPRPTLPLRSWEPSRRQRIEIANPQRALGGVGDLPAIRGDFNGRVTQDIDGPSIHPQPDTPRRRPLVARRRHEIGAKPEDSDSSGQRRGVSPARRGASGRRQVHGPDEPVPYPANRLHVSRSLGGVVQSLPQVVDRFAQAGRVHVGPVALQQLVLGEDVAGSFQQSRQQLDGLARQRQLLPVPTQLLGAQVRLKGAESNDRVMENGLGHWTAPLAFPIRRGSLGASGRLIKTNKWFLLHQFGNDLRITKDWSSIELQPMDQSA